MRFVATSLMVDCASPDEHTLATRHALHEHTHNLNFCTENNNGNHKVSPQTVDVVLLVVGIRFQQQLHSAVGLSEQHQVLGALSRLLARTASSVL